MSKIYIGSTELADTSTLSGGTLVPTVLNVAELSQTFNILDVGEKTFYITNSISDGRITELDGTPNPFSTNIQISDGGNSINQTFKNYFGERLYTDSDTSKFTAMCPCTLNVTMIPDIAPGNFTYTTSGWTTKGNLNVATQYNAGAGIQNAGLTFGGSQNGSTALNDTELFNGAAWSESAHILLGRWAFNGAGIQNAGLAFGGYTGSSGTGETEKFDGSIWTTSGNMTYPRLVFAGCGLQSAALAVGGYNIPLGVISGTELFNGIAWSNSSNASYSVGWDAACGIQTAALRFGGSTSGADIYNYNEGFNGTSWSTLSNLNHSVNQHAGCGARNAALCFGGSIGTGAYNTTQSFNGTSWSMSNPLSSNHLAPYGAGSQSAGLCFGGNLNGSSVTAITEAYNINTNNTYPSINTISYA